MDVRCEKCQTEYELDESRLKPGGVTVKCTNCGHMFKIRKRTPTNVGVNVNVERARTGGSKPPVVGGSKPTQAVSDEAPTSRARPLSDELPTARATTEDGEQRQWLIRLENGEQKSCRELAMLQQWIVAGVVTRESLISRSGKTWKRLGDIGELGQYFKIADEARNQRSAKPTPAKPAGVSTLPGHKPAPAAAAAGGTVLPDDDLERRSTGNFQRRPKTTPPPPPPARTPPVGAPQVASPRPNPLAQTELAAPQMPPPAPAPPAARAKPPSVPEGGRSTALWASSEIKASESMAAMPQGPLGGKLSAIPDEPAFAGRVRMGASDESSFDTGQVGRVDEDDDYLPAHRGSRAGLVITILSLLVIAGAAGVIYMFAFRQDKRAETPPARDAAAAPVAVVKADAAVAVAPSPDAAAPPSSIETGRTELAGDVGARMKGALDALASQDDPDALALRARLAAAIAQDELDRAGLVDKDAGDKLRKDARELVTQAAPLAQRAVKAKADDAAANLAMAEILRLELKSAREVHRYLDTARDKAGPDAELGRAAALAAARLLQRDKKLDDAAKVLAAVDGSDVRVAIAGAVIAHEQNRGDDAKKLLDTVIAQAPDQETAQALAKKLELSVSRTDPLPPEDHHGGSATPTPTPTPTPDTGGGYDALVAKANALAESNCAKAMELYQKALDIKAQGVEALTGMGYCHLDAKQFASAFSNFRSALMVSPRYEPALGGIAETYQRQGNRDQAIESWRKYLEMYPGSPKAKKQLEILGASDEGSAAPTPTPTPTPTPAPTPAPTPTPTPAPTPAAAGSGSG